MRGYLMLADFAETINGKLYIQGGGWTRVASSGAPFTLYLGGKIFVPWASANRKCKIALQLMDSDGQPVIATDGQRIHLEGEFEVGRPPGLSTGTDLDFPISFKFEGLQLSAGRYRWELSVNGDNIEQATFDVVVGSL